MSQAAGVNAAAGPAVQQAIVTQATRGTVVIVRLDGNESLSVVQHAEAPVAVTATCGTFSTKHQDLTGYNGVAFCTKTDTPLPFPQRCELVQATGIWISAA